MISAKMAARKKPSRTTLSRSSSATEAYDPHRNLPSDTVHITIEPVQNFNRGELSWFEKKYYELDGPDSTAHELESLRNMLSPESLEQFDDWYVQMLVTELKKKHRSRSLRLGLM